MDVQETLRLLQNAGFRVLGTDAQYIYIEDPACILRAFATFAEYAWIVLVCVTGLLLFGWAISMIRGAKNDIFTNMRNLILIFGIVSVAGPIVNVVFGEDLFKQGCDTVKISRAEVQSLMDARKSKLAKQSDNLYEEFDIYDTGATFAPETPIDDETTAPDEAPGNVPPQQEEPEDTGHGANSPAQPTTQSSDRPIRAHESGRDVVYTYQNDSRTRRSRGTRAWRNNNPGNIRPGRFSDGAGGIGRAGGFAAFPDEGTGMDAIVRLLQTSRYQSKTLAEAISAWAPPSDGNNTSAYKHRVANATGVPLSTRLSALNEGQLRQIAQIIRQIEGWAPGSETRE